MIEGRLLSSLSHFVPCEYLHWSWSKHRHVTQHHPGIFPLGRTNTELSNIRDKSEDDGNIRLDKEHSRSGPYCTVYSYKIMPDLLQMEFN